jgi:hypothetical protein
LFRRSSRLLASFLSHLGCFLGQFIKQKQKYPSQKVYIILNTNSQNLHQAQKTKLSQRTNTNEEIGHMNREFSKDEIQIANKFMKK